jgi:hypothetical protein
MITIFCNFWQFSAKNWHFYQKNQCYDQFFAQFTSVLSQKRQFFRWIFRRKYLKNHNIGPWFLVPIECLYQRVKTGFRRWSGPESGWKRIPGSGRSSPRWRSWSRSPTRPWRAWTWCLSYKIRFSKFYIPIFVRFVCDCVNYYVKSRFYQICLHIRKSSLAHYTSVHTSKQLTQSDSLLQRWCPARKYW